MEQLSDSLPWCEIMNDVVLMAAILSGLLAGRWLLFGSGYTRKDNISWPHCRNGYLGHSEARWGRDVTGELLGQDSEGQKQSVSFQEDTSSVS
jgi:hypothetical protein